MYKIEKNIPVSGVGQKTGAPRKYPFRKMVVGDSFFVKGDKKKIQSIRQLILRENKLSEKYRWISRAVDNGVRVWCLEKTK